MSHDRRSYPDSWAGRPRGGSSAYAQLAALVTAHSVMFDLLIDATKSLTAEQWGAPTGCPDWDVHDQLAHCVGVERCLLDEPAAAVADRSDQTDDQAFLRAVQADVWSRRGVPHESLREEAGHTFAQRLRQLRRLEAAALDAEVIGPGGLRLRGARMLRLRVFDLLAHEQDIRRALGRPREPDGTPARLVSEHLLHTWSRHWRRDVFGPGEVVIEIDGDPPASTTVELLGSVGNTPRARLRGPLSALLPLACGRSDAPDGAVVFADGDERLARRVIAAAGITP